jgi:hypothetical protein
MQNNILPFFNICHITCNTLNIFIVHGHATPIVCKVDGARNIILSIEHRYFYYNSNLIIYF